MYREKAKELLNRLLDTNYVKGPHFPIDIYTQTLIDCIANECKSTVVPPEGNAHRYESSFTLDTVKKLIGVFITNSCTVPKSIMNNSIYERGGFAGLDADVNIYKGIDSETGKFEAYLSRAYIDERDYGIPREVIEEMYKKYAREIVLEDARKKDRTVPKFSGFQLFMERMTHMPFTRQHFVNEYMKLLKEYSGLTSVDTLRNSAEYKVRQMTSQRFINGIFESMRKGTIIDVADRGKNDLKNTINQIASEMVEQMISIPNLSSTFSDTNQVFKDAKTQLTAYSMDFRGMSPQEIEESIKKINSLSITDERAMYAGENGYRATEVCISGTDIKLLGRQNVPDAMRLLSEDIYTFVNNSNELSDTDYLKKATSLMYRFIRIHPFADSNGRTSRALFNAMTLNRDILVPFSKEDKSEFIRRSNIVHNNLDDLYLYYISHDSEEADQMEKNAITPLWEFVSTHAIIPNKQRNKEENHIELENEFEK